MLQLFVTKWQDIKIKHPVVLAFEEEDRGFVEHAGQLSRNPESPWHWGVTRRDSICVPKCSAALFGRKARSTVQ